MYETMEVVANIIDLGIMLYIADKFFERKEKYSIKLIMIILILQSLFMRFTNIIFGNASILSTIINILLWMVVLRGFYKLNLRKVIGLYSLLFLFMLIVEAMLTTFMNTFLNTAMEDLLMYESTYRIIGIVLSKAIIILFTVSIPFLINKHDIKTMKYIPLVSLMLVVNICTHLIMLELYTGNIEKYIDESYAILIFFVLINTINILSFFIVIKIINYIEKEIRWKSTENEYEKQIVYFENYNEVSTEIKQLKHDLTKHVISISEYLDNGQVEEARDYINDLLGDYKNKNAIMSIKNKIIASIINYKIKIMNSNDISFEFYSNVPEKTHIKDVDLTIILSNILDNAVEACQNISLGSQKEIELIMEYNNNKLLIRETNTFEGTILCDKDKILTTKTDEYNHGFGLENITKSVKKYNGSCNISTMILEIVNDLW